MIFADIIKDIVENVDGCWSGIMMGTDGVMVESYKKETDDDITTMSVEFANVLRNVCNSSEQLDTGNVQEITIKTDQLTYLIRMVNEEYFVAVVLKPFGNYGKARYLIKKAIPAFAEEL